MDKKRTTNEYTPYIVANFIYAHLKRRGMWKPEYEDIYPHEIDFYKPVPKICQSLYEISTDLQDFLRESPDNIKFEEALHVLDPEVPFIFSGLQQVADELFLKRITWTHIVTFLYYCGEFVCKITTIPDKEFREDTWCQTIDWITSYMGKKLTPWISQQNCGWLDVINNTNSTNKECLCKSQKTLRHYASITATIAVILGGLYLGSKVNFS